jgi:outer membrane protein OmpA-like peptidoglycan-associated protein
MKKYDTEGLIADLKKSKDYLDKLVEGINPVNGKPISTREVIYDYKVSRQLEFLSEYVKNEIKRLEGIIEDCCANNNPSSDVNSPKPSEDPNQITDPSEPNQQIADNNEIEQPSDDSEVAQPRDPHKVEWLTPTELINVRFATGTATMLKASMSDLDAFALKVKHAKNNDRDILIIAYTNDPTAYGKQMSERRAMAIKKYLISKGVPANRLIATGMRLRNIAEDPDGRYEDNRIMVGLEVKQRDK